MKSSLGEGFFPQFLVGFSILWYFGLLPSPIPAIPPYLVKTHHIHGPWPIAATTSGSTPDEVLVNSRCLLEDIYWSTRQSHRRPKKSSIKKFDTLLCCFRPARFAAGPLYRFGFISLRSLLSQLTPSMTEITLGHTFCEQILSKRAVILQVTPEHVRYLLILVFVYEHLGQDA